MTQALTFGPHNVELSNTGKLFFPHDGLTKGDLIDYYYRIAETMLLHVKERPLTLHRFPDGIEGDDFYQQQLSDYFPDWISRATVEKKNGEPITHVVCNTTGALVYLANQACITPHIWLSRTDKLDYPDRLLIDLDPPDDDDPGAVRSAALHIRDVFDALELTSFVMTSGSRGYHIVVPLDRSQAFDTVRSIARAIADTLAERAPDRFTTEQRKKKRGDRVFLDTLRNSYAHTSVAPYSVRARPGAPVATPLEWAELAREPIHPRHYTIQNIFRRLGQRDDPWRAIGRHGQSLDGVRERLDRL